MAKTKKTKTTETTEEPLIEVELDSQEEPQEAAAETPIALTPLAVKMVCEIIAVCTKRGAFNPEELTAVGNLYDQLRAQLPAPAPAEENAAAEEQLELELEEATK